ncbi:MAG: ABC transporter ATP-binding protein [Anaerolineaceae bacterium]
MVPARSAATSTAGGRARKLPDPYTRIGQRDAFERIGESILALDDVSFTVEQGEALGIIGRNGAGKSTLLKILSRVTAPTSGVVKVKGRIASLLEVGTGFHPELTGRENIYLNGAILGMTRAEITRKLDEIVSFAEIEKFVNTPVKRYSSGMYVRLAFAVAAHLDSEILIVDEVLAVGDASFQKKCLGKMGDVASKEGRTVLFVSHNMGSIQELCPNSALLHQGRLLNIDTSARIVQQYLGLSKSSDNLKLPIDVDNLRIIDFYIEQDHKRTSTILPDSPFEISIVHNMKAPTRNVLLGFDLISERGYALFRTYDLEVFPLENFRTGQTESVFFFPAKTLQNGNYYINLIAAIHRKTPLNVGRVSLSFTVNGSRKSDVDFIGEIQPPGKWGSRLL